MSQRTQRRPQWGWETPWDLYYAIEKIMGTGELTYTHEGDRGLHRFTWYVGGRKHLGAAQCFTDRDIMVYRVADLAREFVGRARADWNRILVEESKIENKNSKMENA